MASAEQLIQKRKLAAQQRKKQRDNALRKIPDLTKSELVFIEGCPLFAARVVIHVVGHITKTSTQTYLRFMTDPDLSFEWFTTYIGCDTGVNVFADAEKCIHLITHGKTCRQIWTILNPQNEADGMFTIYI